VKESRALLPIISSTPHPIVGVSMKRGALLYFIPTCRFFRGISKRFFSLLFFYCIIIYVDPPAAKKMGIFPSLLHNATVH